MKKLISRVALSLLVIVSVAVAPQLAEKPRVQAAGPVTMAPGTSIHSPGTTLFSPNARYRFVYQADGNLGLYEDQHPHDLWRSSTYGSNPDRLVMQTDGNLVLYDSNNYAIWHTHTWGNPGAYLSLQDDGNLVIYRPDGQYIWTTWTYQYSIQTQMTLINPYALSNSYSWWKGATADGIPGVTSMSLLAANRWVDWSNDSCSAPLLGDSPWDFSVACKRHDFGYRNLQRMERDDPGADTWRGSNRNATDSEFKTNMYSRCGEWNIVVRPLCWETADLYYDAVQTFGGPFSTSGYGWQSYAYN